MAISEHTFEDFGSTRKKNKLSVRQELWKAEIKASPSFQLATQNHSPQFYSQCLSPPLNFLQLNIKLSEENICLQAKHGRDKSLILTPLFGSLQRVE